MSDDASFYLKTNTPKYELILDVKRLGTGGSPGDVGEVPVT